MLPKILLGLILSGLGVFTSIVIKQPVAQVTQQGQVQGYYGAETPIEYRPAPNSDLLFWGLGMPITVSGLGLFSWGVIDLTKKSIKEEAEKVTKQLSEGRQVIQNTRVTQQVNLPQQVTPSVTVQPSEPLSQTVETVNSKPQVIEFNRQPVRASDLLPPTTKSTSFSSPVISTIAEEESDLQELTETPTTLKQKLNAKLVAEVFADLGFKCSPNGEIDGPSFTRCKIIPDRKQKIAHLLLLEKDLLVQLNTPEMPLITAQPGHLAVDFAKPVKERWYPKYIDYKNRLSRNEITIPIGLTLEKEVVELSIEQDAYTHWLVGGTSGSGKSNFAISVVLSLIDRFSPTELQLAMSDVKCATLSPFKEIPWLYMGKLATQVDETIAIAQSLVDEMEVRNKQLFPSKGVSKLSQFNNRSTEKLPRIIFFIEELKELFEIGDEESAEYNSNDDAKIKNSNDDAKIKIDKTDNLKRLLGRLAQAGRSAGIHLFVSSQKFLANTVGSEFRSNLSTRVCLRCTDSATGTTILGEQENYANKLLGNGDLLLKETSNMRRLQALYFPEDEISDYLNSLLSKEVTEMSKERSPNVVPFTREAI